MRFGVVVVVLALAACGSVPQYTPASSPLSIPQLKFAVIDAVGKPAYCDPDMYPIAREGGEEANAVSMYPQIEADTVTYTAIVAHEHLPAGNLTDAQKLTVYQAWKLLRAISLNSIATGYSFQYRIQSRGGSAAYETVSGTESLGGAVTVTSRVASGPPVCPICLAASTLIATPDGGVRVTDVRVGMVVWTQAADGSRVAAPVVEVGSMEAPVGHMMVHLVLADGRELLVSPGHMTADGRAAGSLGVGDVLDGSTVTSFALVPYAGGRTYDLLPAGATSHYWANGILMASTLARRG